MPDMKETLGGPSQLSATKQAILEKLLRGELAGSPWRDVIPCRPRPQDSAPVSFAQQRLWFLNRLESNSPFYNISSAVRLSGVLDIPNAERSVNEILLRHEVLRTVFTEVDGQTRQVIMPHQVLRIGVQDLGSLPKADREREARRLMAEELKRPFDLTAGPLLRLMLLRLGKQEHILVLTMHHIVSDGWSMDVFIREMTVFYSALLNGKSTPLPRLPIQYADYAVWQREWLSGKVLDEQLSYWKGKLQGMSPILPLPTDRPRPTVQTYRGATVAFTLSKSIREQLHGLSRKEGVTLFMTLLAAFYVLLYRYSGQEDISVGTPIANRNRLETEALMGLFINTLVLRSDLSGDPSFHEFLKRVQQMVLGAHAHQDLPFERLVEELQPVRSLSHSPLFQITFTFENPSPQPLQVPGLRLTPVMVEDRTAKFDLSLNMAAEGEGLSGVFEYSTDLFDEETLMRMAGHYQTLLEGIVAHPESRISDLPMLTKAEQHQVLLDWNATQIAHPLNQNVIQLFEAQVQRTPEAVALVFQGRQLTYAKLNALANQLGHYLRDIGIGPEHVVGLCTERSIEMVIGILGILKAGGAYVPLDPAYPKERLAVILNDAQIRMLITQERFVERLPDHENVICLDSDWDTIAHESLENPSGVLNARCLAYVIYTSGSTGKPKGVQVEHRGLSNLVFWHQRAFGLTHKDRSTLVASPAFDAAVWEIWPYLTVGATIHIIDDETRLAPSRLRDCLGAHAITISFLPTPLTHEILSLDWQCDQGLRTLLTGGEKLLSYPPPSLPFQLVNNYGPTETTVVATSGLITPNEEPNHAPNIGRPIDNAKIYLLDPFLQPVPVGIPGELYIAGAGIARGYWRHPELTAQRFIPNPFSTEPGDRLYKTGDLARYGADGTIEFLGRVDHQVKIRGYRIELGDIEAQLREHREVQEAVVVARPDDAVDLRLIAYVVLHKDSGTTERDLRQWLQAQLPEYMIPAFIVLLDALPMTPNGKLDRNALPAPDISSQIETRYIAPRTSMEKLLASIWSEVLSVKRIGVQDNFFELGGDSILSLQVVARARNNGLALTPRQIFQYQTISELAAVVVRSGSFREEELIPVEGEVPLTPIQHHFFEQGFPNPHHYNQSVLLEVKNTADLAALETAIEAVTAHHDAFRLRFTQQEEGVWSQAYGTSSSAPIFHRVDLPSVSEEEGISALQAAVTEWQASLQLTEGPLIRVVLFNLGQDQPARLLIIIHHLIVDGVSWRILLEDLQIAYRQLREQKPVILPPKTTSLKRWAERLRESVMAGSMQEDSGYWLDVLRAGVKPLPADNQIASATEATAEVVTVSLEEEETRLLLQDVSRIHKTQINDVLLTALTQVLSLWSASQSVLIDVEGHGREELFSDTDLSRTVGWFTSIFPVLLHVSFDAGPEEMLKSVKEYLARIPHRGISFGVLRYLSPESDLRERLSALPARQVSFNYLGQFDQTFPENAPFQPARESIGRNRDSRCRMPYVLDIVATVFRRQLNIAWCYSRQHYRRETIERLGQDYLEALKRLIRHCVWTGASNYTPADFPDIEFDQTTLNHILEKMKK